MSKKPRKYIYMVVAADIYELPVLVTENIQVVADFIGISYNSAVWYFTPSGMNKFNKTNKRYRFYKVDYYEVMNDD